MMNLSDDCSSGTAEQYLLSLKDPVRQAVGYSLRSQASDPGCGPSTIKLSGLTSSAEQLCFAGSTCRWHVQTLWQHLDFSAVADPLCMHVQCCLGPDPGLLQQ